MRTLRIFISSPSDVRPEREIVERVVARLSTAWKGHLQFVVVRWERKHFEAVTSFQQAIGSMAAFDVVVGILWKRVGSPLALDQFRRDDGSAYESGTVFEIEDAIQLGERNGSPAVFIYRKSAPVTFSAENVRDDEAQYSTLNDWWNRTIRDSEGHYRRGYLRFASSDEFEQRIQQMLEDFVRDRALVPVGPAWNIDKDGSPYPGLLPYDGTYNPVFFGRSLAVAASLAELIAAAERDAPVLIVVGPSGSGKSSLVRAGLVPALVNSGTAGIDFFRQALFEPAQDPILSLAQRLYEQTALPELGDTPQPNPRNFATLIRRSAESAVQSVRWALERAAEALPPLSGGRQPVGRLLLNLDQLEAILSSPDCSILARFVLGLVESECIWLIGSIRADRYQELQAEPAFLALRRRSALFDLPAPGPSEIADIVKGPAYAAGLTFEERDGQSLAQVVTTAVSGHDALPLLQMTLASLFRLRVGTQLTYDAYNSMGGLEGAIAAHADAIFASVSPEGQTTLDALFRFLVADIDDRGRLTIRTPPRSSICTTQAATELLKSFTENRLLITTENDVRLSHEALLRNWQRAIESPALQPDAIRLRRQIEPDLRDWRNSHSDSDLLQAGTALSIAEQIVRNHPGAFPPELDDYVLTSARRATERENTESRRLQFQTRRDRRIRQVSIVAAISFAILSLVALESYRQANHNLVLALLARAEDFLAHYEPAHASVVAGKLATFSEWRWVTNQIGLTDANSDEAVQVKTIAGISNAAVILPVEHWEAPRGVTSAAVSPEGRFVAAGYTDGEVVIFRANHRGEPIHLHGHRPGRVDRVQFSPDRRLLISYTSEEALLWDLRARTAESFCIGEENITDAALDPTSHFIVLATKDGKVEVIDLSRPRAVPLTFQDHSRWTTALTFNTSGALFASAGDDGSIVLRRTSDWSVISRFDAGISDIVGLSLSPDGMHLAVASVMGPTKVWDVGPGGVAKVGTVLLAPPEKRYRILYSPDGHWLALASWDGTVHLYDGQTLAYKGTIDKNDQRVNQVAFSNDSPTKFLLTASESGAIRLWKLSDVRPMFRTYSDDSRETQIGVYSPDGKYFVSGGKDGFAKLYKVAVGGDLSFVCSVDHRPHWVLYAAFSPDSKEVASVGLAETASDPSNLIKIWRVPTCQVEPQYSGLTSGYVGGVAFSPRGNTLAWGDYTGRIYTAALFPHSLKQELTPRAHFGTVTDVSFSHDGDLLVSGARDGSVAVWDMHSRSLSAQLRKAGGPPVETVSFSSAGLVAVGGSEDSVYVWNVHGQARLVARLPIQTGTYRLAFNSSGSKLAAGSVARSISEWSTLTWRKTLQLNVLVGLRSVFGYRRKTDDLAFDGENGLIRIMPGLAKEAIDDSEGDLNGIAVSFDHDPIDLAEARSSGDITLKEQPCSRVQLGQLMLSSGEK
ncbi:hypothetical protein [Acidisoma sp. L85]|uniref:nSTAND1 domain-containing NTPase n=1 Tax=Acidisoma sp. L85 TaxID=1641850 RepID=UPI00131D1B5F|nr:hypothetical protein [Acidisoma sp. L85]